jgi:hypothetical protein
MSLVNLKPLKSLKEINFLNWRVLLPFYVKSGIDSARNVEFYSFSGVGGAYFARSFALN